MSNNCEITAKRVSFGNRVSKAKNKSRRTFSPNLQEKNLWVQELKATIKINVSTKAMRTINKHGPYQTMKKAKKKGTLSPRLTRLVTTL